MEELSIEKSLEEGKEKLQNKVFNWLKNPLNLSLVLVLLFAFAIRLYYLFLTKGQPLWWDEACYGSLAKNILTSLWSSTDLITSESIIRPPLFALAWAILIFLNIPETGTRFILEIIPSFLSVFFVYLIAKEIFNKRTGIFAAFIFSVLWIHLFYSIRFLTDVPSLLFLFASIYLFIKANKNELNYNFLL